MPFFIFLRFRYAPRSCNYRNVDEKRDVQSARVSFAQRGGRALRFQIDSVVSNFPPPRKSVSYNEKELSKQPNKAHRGIHIFLCNQANMKWSFYPLSNWNTLLVWPKLCVAYEWICIIHVKINFAISVKIWIFVGKSDRINYYDSILFALKNSTKKGEQDCGKEEFFCRGIKPPLQSPSKSNLRTLG